MKEINVVHLGLTGFPFGSACVNKCLFIYKALADANVKVKIINKKAIHRKADIPIQIYKHGVVDDHEYYYTTPSPYRSDYFFKRNLSKVIGIINEFRLIAKFKFSGKLDVAFVYLSTDSFINLLWYRFLSKIFRFPIVINWVELFSAFPDRKKSLILKLNDHLFDNYFMYFVDAVLPISELLIKKLILRKPTIPFLKVPGLVDFSLYDNIKKNKTKSFVYCGSASYMNVIEFIINSFDLIEDEDYFLELIIKGNKNQLYELFNLIRNSKKNKQIRHYQNLKYDILLEMYLNASALLIPMRSGIQDEARFPQKIAEYVASGNPIITTNYGEPSIYFTDNENALIANEFNIDQYAEKMKFVISNPEKAELIGLKGKEIGQKNFNYNSYSKPLMELIDQISS